MKRFHCFAGALFGVCLLSKPTLMAQTDQSTAERWLATVETGPEFKVADSVRGWERQRKQVREQLWKLLGNLPPRPKAPEVQTISRDDRGSYVVEKFEFANGAGSTVPGYLLLPKGINGPAPAILYCHWHGGQYDIGKEELFRTNATPIPAGPELAKRGYVVIAVDACCFGERNGKGPGGPTEKGSAGEMTASKFNLWASRTLWGMILRDDLMALDYLCSRPEVDATRIGVTGISMGATRTWWLMALDERLKAGVAVCCLTRYQNLIQVEGLKHHGIYYFVPGMLNHFDTEAVVALAAPRPLLFQSGETDAGSPIAGIRVIESKVRKAYALYDRSGDFESRIHPGVGHVYLPEMWQRTLEWMDRYLRTEATPSRAHPKRRSSR